MCPHNSRRRNRRRSATARRTPPAGRKRSTWAYSRSQCTGTDAYLDVALELVRAAVARAVVARRPALVRRQLAIRFGVDSRTVGQQCMGQGPAAVVGEVRVESGQDAEPRATTAVVVEIVAEVAAARVERERTVSGSPVAGKDRVLGVDRRPLRDATSGPTGEVVRHGRAAQAGLPVIRPRGGDSAPVVDGEIA